MQEHEISNISVLAGAIVAPTGNDSQTALGKVSSPNIQHFGFACSSAI